MAVLTLSGNKSDFARRARLHREQTLLAAAKCGDRAAFDELFQPLANGTLQIAYRITRNREDAEDALQDSFVLPPRHVETFEGRSSFSSWFTSIAINSALMILRKNRNSFEIPADGSGNPDAIGRLGKYRTARRIPRSIACKKSGKEFYDELSASSGLPFGVVEMQQLQEHSMKETEWMMGISVAAAKARLLSGQEQERGGTWRTTKGHWFIRRAGETERLIGVSCSRTCVRCFR